jgi:hypothetical protein
MTLPLKNLFAGIFIIATISACSKSVDSNSSASASASANTPSLAAPLPSAMQFDVELHTDAKDEEIDVFILALKNRGFSVEHSTAANSTKPGEKHVITAKQNKLLPKVVIDVMTEELKKMAPAGKFSHSFSVSQSS